MSKHKGVELPVNVLVIIAIAVIVLLGLIVLLSFGTAGANPILITLDKGPACQQYNCGASTTVDQVLVKRDITGDGKVDSDDTIGALCKSAGSCVDPTSETQVQAWCGCQVKPAP